MIESVENSPFALALAQIVLFVVQAIIYSRQKSALDVEKRDRAVFGPQVTHALEVAQSAKRDVETIELAHYKKLAALFEAQSTELANAKAQIRALEETVQSLANKLASRDRADRAAEKRKGKGGESEGEEEPAGDPQSLEDLIRNGIAVPLNQGQPPAKQGGARPFGVRP